MNTYKTFINYLIKKQKINHSDIITLLGKNNITPQDITSEMQSWYIGLGITEVTKRPFALSPCPFTSEEINLIEERNEIIICIPKEITALELSKLFRIDSWAVHDLLVDLKTEKKDIWLKTSADPTPKFLGVTGIDIKNTIEDNNWIPFSLTYYMVFIARYRYLFNKNPDQRYWIWLSKGRYDRSGMLIAGFDNNDQFNVHGWMPHFSANFLGARYLETSIASK